MTYSIVARDPRTGTLGAAVQSCVSGVGPRILLAEPGVGVVAVQAESALEWRNVVLDLLSRGMRPDQVVAMLSALPESEVTQVGMVDANGRTAVSTGSRCTGHAGHAAGPQATVQANLMVSPTVWPAMLAAYEAAVGDGEELAESMLAALDAAEGEGGDVRGAESAALLTVGPMRGALATGNSDDPCMDLRVDDSPDPLRELRRLLALTRAHRLLMRYGEVDTEAERLEAARASVRAAPDDPKCVTFTALVLWLAGERDEAEPLVQRALAIDPKARTHLTSRAEGARQAGRRHAGSLLERLGTGGG